VSAENLYLDLLKKALTRSVFEEHEPVAVPRHPDGSIDVPALEGALANGATFTRRTRPDPLLREFGRDRPAEAETMVGLRRLTHLEECIVTVLEEGVPGDLLEAGVWRGGACILMRAVLEAHGDRQRCVWVADSFAGVPPPDPQRYPADNGLDLYRETELAVGSEEVKTNFVRYGLLDTRVRFLHGFFADSLPAAPVASLAVLRVDGDLYQSTMEVLTHLYPKVSPGGFVIVDDYGAIPACRAATDDFRAASGITDELVPVDWTAVAWRRLAPTGG
jgi:O-methyltransferase